MIKNTDKKDKFLQRICLLLNLGDKNLCLVFFQTSVYFPLQLHLKNKAEMHKSTDIYGEREQVSFIYFRKMDISDVGVCGQ